jgi:hypothetical protein
MAGIPVRSEIELPGQIVDGAAAVSPEVVISVGTVAHSFGDPAAVCGPNWECLGDKFILRIPNIGRLLLIAGRQVYVDVGPDGDVADTAAFLMGSALGILMHQRGQLAFHASAVQVGESAVLFMGPTGAGKSTMAAALGQLKYAVVSDDLCAVTMLADGRAAIVPDGRQLKLWNHAVEGLGIAAHRGQKVRQQLEKYYMASDATPQRSLPIAAIYVLHEARAGDTPGIEGYNIVDAALALRRNIYRGYLVPHFGLQAQYFQTVSAIASKTKVCGIKRPLGFDHLHTVVDWLEAHWGDIGVKVPA